MSYDQANKIADIESHGYTDVPFLLAEKERANFAALANMVIDIALEDDAVRQALHFKLNAASTVQDRIGTYGLALGAGYSPDEKITLDIGYQSHERANAILGMRQPRIMGDFWEATHDVLNEVEKTTKSTFKKLGAEAVVGAILTDKTPRRNIHLRTIRYIDAAREPVGTEVVGGHADVGIATLHLYETHSGWLQAAPYPLELMTEDDSPERRHAILAMRASMQTVDNLPHTVPFLLGASWRDSKNMPNKLSDLPACYHAGFVPELGRQAVSQHASEVTRGADDRVSVVAFLNPNTVAIAKSTYQLPPLEHCRPKY